ncbi:MAG: hypothetical protein LBF85_01985, partial [Tannerella sp.]|nr:hypothetical protein [Tannerella sp.]
MRNCILLLCILFPVSCFSEGTTGKFTVDSDGLTVLMAKDAVLQGGLKPYRIEPVKAFWVENWTDSSQRFTWELSAARKGLYKVNVLYASDDNASGADKKISIEIDVNGKKSTMEIPHPSSSWSRYALNQTLELEDGNNSLSLGLSPASGEGHSLQLYSIELLQPQVEKQIAERAARLQSRPQWFSDARYGFFFHWNSKSMPRRGDALTYNEAVESFDVASFAKTVHEGGADFIIFTTSWAEYYFPAP